MMRHVVTTVAIAALGLTTFYISTTAPGRAQSFTPACLQVRSDTWVGTQCISVPYQKFTILDGICNNFAAHTGSGTYHGGGDMTAFGYFDDGGPSYDWTGTFSVEKLPDGSCM